MQPLQKVKTKMNFLTICKYVGPVGKNGKKYVTDYDTYFSHVLVGNIYPNPNNRSIDWNHVNEMFNGFDINSFGEIIGIEVQMGAKGLVFQQRSAHHRNEVLKLVHAHRKGFGSDGKLPLYISVYPSAEAAKMYVTEGNTKRLQAKDLLLNPEYAFHNTLKSIISVVDLSPYRGYSFFTDKSHALLGSIVNTLSNHPNDYSAHGLGTVINYGKDVRKIAGFVKGDPLYPIKLDNKLQKNLKAAMEYAVEVFKGVIDEGDLLKGQNKGTSALSEQGRKILRCKMLFVYLVWNKITNGSVTAILPTTLARTLVSKDSEMVTNALNALNNKDTNTFAAIIHAIARTKTGYKRNTDKELRSDTQ
jgi:hypothetical protein